MPSEEIWFGNIVEATSSKIVINDGFRQAEYFGSFSYSNSGEVTGILESVNEYRGGTLIYSVNDIGADARQVYNAIQILADFDLSASIILAKNDTLNGSFGVDILKSYAGNDFISGNGGDDTLDGGDGTDTSQIAAASTAATITINADGTISVTDRNGVEGTDTLVSIENIAFTDRTLDMNAFSSLTQLSNDQFTELAEMYVAYFNRAPDAEGLFYWADKLAEGRTMDQIAERFFDQDETRALYTDPSNTDAFVTAVYANVLGRTPDADGFAFWTGKLAAGEVTQGAFVLKIILGAKNGGGANDVAYLSDKADVGLYFSAIKGMSDSTDGRQVMATFGDQSTSNKSGAKTAVDGHYADATVSGGGEFIFDVVGVVNDPFAGII
jgi:Ca2+-binding RTX toxin-like protein